MDGARPTTLAELRARLGDAATAASRARAIDAPRFSARQRAELAALLAPFPAVTGPVVASSAQVA